MTDPTDPTTPLLPAPAKPHPVDVALAAIGEVAAETLASGRHSRFAELQSVAVVALHVQRLRPPEGVDDAAEMGDGDFDNGPMMMANPVRRRRGIQIGGRFNDVADLNTQILMMAQSFLEKYADIEKLKAKPSGSRMSEVMELESLMGLRSQLTKNSEEVPRAISTRIELLLNRIGEPTHELEPDPSLHSEPLRGRPDDGAGEPDGGRVGEPIAERAGGDDGPR